MISNIFRKLLECLSFFYKNNLKLVKKNDPIILKTIKKKLSRLSFESKNLKKTHNIFNKKIIYILKKEKLTSFLRNSFVQKMFFVHNRLFVFKELIKLKNNKNWKFYKKIIIEDNVGDPVRYFLYPKSSGNRINHAYHLSVLSSEFNVNLKKINKVFEFGGGYGCMARIFSKINKKISYTCFDTNYINLLQYYYLRQNNLNVGFEKKNNYFLISSFSENKKFLLKKFHNHFFIANWSLSEAPIKFREQFLKMIENSKFILISFQEYFEGIDNLSYFSKLKKKLDKKFHIKILKNPYYNGNIFRRQNHYFLIGKKL